MSMQLAQEQLQNALVTTFLANLAFLNEYDNALFQRVESLSQLINDGLFTENYELEFLEEVGEFDILDIKNNRYLYNKKPKKFINNAIAKTDFTTRGSVSTLENKLYEMKRYNVFDEEEYFCNFEYANKKVANETLEFTKILKNNLSDYRFKQFKQFHKFVFLGTLLGRHIPEIANKIKARNYFVCEKNLEIFRLSLFVVDYTVLARDGRHVFFSIMDDMHDFNDKLENFFSHESYQNYCIKYFSTDYGVEEYFESFTNKTLAHNNTMFNYKMMLENIFKCTTERLNNYHILKLLKQTNNKIVDKPVLFLAAGPSLIENIQWIQKNQKKFIIVAIAATYKVLSKYGIKPDIVTTVDPQYSVLNKKHFDRKNVEKIKDCIVLAAINTDKRILNRFNQEKLFLFESVKPILTENRCYAGFSVGEMSLAIILSLGFKNIYMLGLDLAFNQKTGESHMSGYSNRSHELDSNTEEFSLNEGIVKVRGNKQETVFTSRLFSVSIDAMNTNTSLAKKENQNIYNLSNHGAYFENTIPYNINEIKTNSSEDEVDIKNEINSFLIGFSSSKLNSLEQKKIENEYTYILNFKQYLLNLEGISESFEEFDMKIRNIYQRLFYGDINTIFIVPVFIKFFNIFLQYIYYCLNTKKMKNEKNLVNETENLFIKKLLEVIDKYIDYLKKV